MLLKIKRPGKDFDTVAPHPLSRREFIAQTLSAGMISVGVGDLVLEGLISKAMAQTGCPPVTRGPGCVASLYLNGGGAMSAYFLNDLMANVLTPTIRGMYGIGQNANIAHHGSNFNLSPTSPFGATLRLGPLGWSGGSANWISTVLNFCSLGSILGSNREDDGGGSDLGYTVSTSDFLPSETLKDTRLGRTNRAAPWARGPKVSVNQDLQNITPTSLANAYTLTPNPNPNGGANALMNAEAIEKASNTASELATIFNSIFNLSTRKAGRTIATNATCSFAGNTALANPTYGTGLFNPAGISVLSQGLTLGELTDPEQALLSSFYQSALGVTGGVIIQREGYDYHPGASLATVTSQEINAARTVMMALAAAKLAGRKMALILLSNGNTAAKEDQGGTSLQNSTFGRNNTPINNLDTPIAAGDRGGYFSIGSVLFFDPNGAPPQGRTLGTLNTTTGGARASTSVPSTEASIAILLASACAWVNGTVPDRLVTALGNVGISNVSSKLVLS